MAYFDNAATSYPKPEEVYSFMDDFYRNCGGSSGRGNYALALTSKRIIDETRGLLKELLSCPAKQVIFTPTATIALNMIIQGVIKQGVRNVYISPFEHNAVTRVLHHFEASGIITVTSLAVSNDLFFCERRIGLKMAIANAGLSFRGKMHSALGDATATADIYREMKQGKSLKKINDMLNGAKKPLTTNLGELLNGLSLQTA